MSFPTPVPGPGKVPDLRSLVWLRGSDSDVTGTGRRLKLAVIIQPNCPGCMMHALPVGNNLWRRSKQLAPWTLPEHLRTGASNVTVIGQPGTNNSNIRNEQNAYPQEVLNNLFSSLDVYCLSTAFEDFQYNNVDSAKKLLEGKHVGECLARLGADVRPQCQPCMPVAHDIIVEKPNAPMQLLDLALASSKESARKRLGSIVPQDEVDAHFAKIGLEILPPYIPIYFYCAGANGTPSWVLHKDDGTHLDTLFGWVSESALIDWMIKQAHRAGL